MILAASGNCNGNYRVSFNLPTGMTCQSGPRGSVSTQTGPIWNYWQSSLRKTETRTESPEMENTGISFCSQYTLTDCTDQFGE